MKNNVGQLSMKALTVGIVVCLAIGALVFDQFSFQQKMPPQDGTANRLNELERKNGDVQTKLDHLQQTVDQLRSQLIQSSPAQTKPPKKHH